jgi:hypothetical protein
MAGGLDSGSPPDSKGLGVLSGDGTPKIKFSDRKASVQPRSKPSDILVESLTVPALGGGYNRPSGVEIDPSGHGSGKVLPINNFKAKAGMSGLYLNTTHSS